MKLVDIAEVTQRTGTWASTMRYYEERGLISPVGRRGLRRIYHFDVFERLALISLGRAAGFSLEEVGGMFGADGAPDLDRQQLLAKADELDRKARQLLAMRDGLRHAADCPAPRHAECPKFRRLVKVAGAGRMPAPDWMPAPK